MAKTLAKLKVSTTNPGVGVRTNWMRWVPTSLVSQITNKELRELKDLARDCTQCHFEAAFFLLPLRTRRDGTFADGTFTCAAFGLEWSIDLVLVKSGHNIACFGM